jgi:hypothetical protein
MKFIKYSIVCLLLAGTLVNCNEDTINLDPIGDSEASFFQNEMQMNQAVLGVYQKLNFFYQWGNDRVLHKIWLLPSDDLTNQGGLPEEIFVSLNGGTGSLSAYYRFAYQLIARANIVLEKIEQNGDIAYEKDSELIDFHRGEALFLRAWMFHRLWNVYGTAPVVIDRIVELENAFPPNSTGTELLDQAIEDLEAAVNLLPESWDAANLGRVTKSSARGLLGKVLVFRGTVSGSASDFDEAVSALSAIQDKSLMPNFNDNFDSRKENNDESLFEFQANRAPGNANPWVGGGNDAFAVIGEINSYYGYFDNRGYGGNSRAFSATESLKMAFDTLDPRAQYTINFDDEVHNILKYVIDSSTTYVPGRAGQGLSQNNTRILRYADVLLLEAEAIVRSGGSLQDAINLVNQVRDRARRSNPDGSISEVPANLEVPASADEALDLIFEERRIELAAEEGHRWYDLRRRHLAGEIDLTSWDFSSVRDDFNFQEFNLYFPLPENEVLQNANMVQNAGY